MTAKEFSSVLRSSVLRKPREMTATEVAASRYADAIRCRMAGIPVAPPLPSGLYDEGFVRMHGTARATGHNPHGLTVAQVGAGWRLLAEEEIIAERRLHGDDRYAIEAWVGVGWDTTGWAGNEDMYTYRTKQPPGYYAAEPPVVPTCPPPAGAKYVHTFVCNGCKLGCTVELVTETPTTKTEPDRCLFVGSAPWHLEATHTLTP